MKYIFDSEVFRYDWLFVFKELETHEYFVFHNAYDEIKEFVKSDEHQIYFGFNNKEYDNLILKAILNNIPNESIKDISDFIIAGNNGWQHRELLGLKGGWFNSCDLMSDMQQGLSLKSIEAHLGMDIEESNVDFNLERPLTPYEIEQTIRYCKFDVDATEKLFYLRKNYLENKLALGRLKNIPDEKALYMTNAKLSAAYLDASMKVHNDSRKYKFPENLLLEYIPPDVITFFDRIHDKSIADEDVFTSKFTFKIQDCEITLGFGGIHGAIAPYREKSSGTRTIRNKDVGSYYPHLMTINGYCSRNIPNPNVYADMLKTRMEAKRNGDKAKANALKLVCNTTYGGMLNQYNDLYDPLMAKSVCISGQLYLLELTLHLVRLCPTLKLIQLNTDGIMISLDTCDEEIYQLICSEWEERTGFVLEEDSISEIIQKDVNNYIEIPSEGKPKIKGVVLVRGISEVGAWNINNNATVVASAVLNYFARGQPVEDTINAATQVLDFQLVAKASSKYDNVYLYIDGKKTPVQKCNRVYAAKDKKYGKLVKTHSKTGTDTQIGGLPEHCLIDNKNTATIEQIDIDWYIKLANTHINAFLGIKPIKVNTRKINTNKRQILKLLED